MMGRAYKFSNLLHYSQLHVEYESYKPQKIGTFAITDSGDFTGLSSAVHNKLKNFKLPLDLNEGYDPNSKEKIINKSITNFPSNQKLLKWICNSDKGYAVTSDISVISQRGALKMIAETLLCPKNSKWILEACLYDGKIYIRFDDDEITDVDKARQKHMYWGMKFHELAIEKITGLSGTYTVVKGDIGNERLLINAEVDCTLKTRDGKWEVGELKSATLRNIRWTFAKHWLQCYLGMVDVILYGFKNSEGAITQPLKRQKMRNAVGERDEFDNHLKIARWKANSMFGVLADVLAWMRTQMDDCNCVWYLDFDNHGPAENWCIKISKDEENAEFLPDWYIQCVEGRNGSASRVKRETGLSSRLADQFSDVSIEESHSNQQHDVDNYQTITFYDRCLFLTDSVLSSTPESVFAEIENFNVRKMVKKYCRDFFQFEEKLPSYGFVIMSFGNNDLRCELKNEIDLRRVLFPWLRRVCQRNSETIFVFVGSLLFAHERQTLEKIKAFNRALFSFSEKYPNLHFFDAHSVLLEDPLTRQTLSFGNVLRATRNPTECVHISVSAAKQITKHLAIAVLIEHSRILGKLIPDSLKEWKWPLQE